MSTHAYAGINSEGKCVAVVVDNPDHIEDTANTVRDASQRCTALMEVLK